MNMKNLLFLLFGIISSLSVQASKEEKGRVNLNGEIFTPACSIASGKYDQTIDLGLLDINNIGRQTFPFSLNITSCVSDTTSKINNHYQTAIIKFDGNGNKEWFELVGETQGIGMEITDSQGHKVSPGIAGESVMLTEENRILRYSVSFILTTDEMKSGHYSSAINFVLDYQ